jgi:hypothetical protein
MRRSDNINDLAAALAKAQAEMRPAAKDAVNPHFKSKYADLASVLDAIRDPFAKHGLSLTQHPVTDGERVAVITMLLHSSGQFLESELTMTPQQKTPQSVGSAITYARRYAAMAVAGLAADDDDGEAASQAPRPARPQPRPTRQAPPEPLDIPFGGPLVPSTYEGEGEQKETLRGLAKLHGLSDGRRLPELHKACLGIDYGNLEAAVKEWISEHAK